MSNQTENSDQADKSDQTPTLDDRVKTVLDAHLPKSVWSPLYKVIYVPIVAVVMFTVGFSLKMYDLYPRKSLVVAAILLSFLYAWVTQGSGEVRNYAMGWMFLYIFVFGIKEYSERGGSGGGGGRTGMWRFLYWK